MNDNINLRFVKCTFCSNMISLLFIAPKQEGVIIKFLENHNKIKESLHSIGIFDPSANRVLIMCNSCSVISCSLKKVNNILEREITGIKKPPRYTFNNNEDKGYWLNPFSTPDFSSVVAIPNRQENTNDSEIGIDMSKAYNYPNPIKEGMTKFRFFVHSSNVVNVTIYDAAGLLVDKLYEEDLIHNTYNEIIWNINNLDSGLYFAELKSDKNESKLIKIVIL